LKFKVEVSEGTAPKEYCSWEEVEFMTTVVTEKLKKSNKKHDIILGKSRDYTSSINGSRPYNYSNTIPTD
jgi:hypothetical protein